MIELDATLNPQMGRNYTLHALDCNDIDPTRFGPVIKAYAFMAVIIGGRGSNTGVLLSGFTLVLLVEGSRFLIDAFGLLDGARLAALRLSLVGVALVVTLIFRPDGLVREYRLTSAAKERP
ncbi:hypothetical protein [Methylobacterium sp. PvR107]|uniref:hypothetical protein n=1 Tax=Methylobacterium sp. PvR107 TaxID=2806597 RepID=UPI001AE4D154|nr:hypothetical protein [Methylobacterium sp. PvR107]MBP1178264.1 ABC-type branched-subunit amino acid transport system permease subunit [Methylobacterium sp. PvR107]